MQRLRSRPSWLKARGGSAVAPQQRREQRRQRPRQKPLKKVRSLQRRRLRRKRSRKNRRPEISDLRSQTKKILNGEDCGSKSSSIRFSTWLQQRLALALVCQKAIRRVLVGGPQAQARSKAAICWCGSFARRYRACSESSQDHHLHLAPGHHHRPQGC